MAKSPKQEQAQSAAQDAETETEVAPQVTDTGANVADIQIIADAAMLAAFNARPALPAPADGAVEISVEAQTVLNLTAALAGIPTDSPMHAVVQAALTDALGVQALADAERLLAVDRANEESQALAVAAANNLPEYVLDSMLAAIESKYAPVPLPAEQPQVPTPTSSKKPIGKVAAERNANVATALATDAAVEARTVATIDTWRQYDAPYVIGVHALANTRYPSMMAFGSQSAGVANRADFETLATAIRLAMVHAPYNYPIGVGEGVADNNWLFAQGPHAPNAGKSADTLRLKFSDNRAVALCEDGRFRLQIPGTPNVRFLHLDAGALDLFKGGTDRVQTATSQTPIAPRVPTPPSGVALPSSAHARTARCQYDNTRNVIGMAQCQSCKASDWYVAAE